jgi:hypothetical protein
MYVMFLSISFEQSAQLHRFTNEFGMPFFSYSVLCMISLISSLHYHLYYFHHRSRFINLCLSKPCPNVSWSCLYKATKDNIEVLMSPNISSCQNIGLPLSHCGKSCPLPSMPMLSRHALYPPLAPESIYVLTSFPKMSRCIS